MRTYVIKSGRHYSTPWFPEFTTHHYFKGHFQFENPLTYFDGADISTNKLFGLSDSLRHHKHSVRIGWRFHKGNWEAKAIFYVSGKRIIKHICNFNPNHINSFIILITKDMCCVSVNGHNAYMKRESKYNGVRYFLRPYFGGHNKAPHKFTIHIDKRKGGL